MTADLDDPARGDGDRLGGRLFADSPVHHAMGENQVGLHHPATGAGQRQECEQARGYEPADRRKQAAGEEPRRRGPDQRSIPAGACGAPARTLEDVVEYREWWRHSQSSTATPIFWTARSGSGRAT